MTNDPTNIAYSQYLRRSDGIWCRLVQTQTDKMQGGFYRFEYLYEYPANFGTDGKWSRSGPLNDLEATCYLAACEPHGHSFPNEAKRPTRMPKDHFLPWTEAELAEMLPITDKT